jgi:hypothetical protein
MSGRTTALALMVAVITACSDFQLSASNLEIGPNPAAPGQQVFAAFNLVLAPRQPYTVILSINDEEHSRVTHNEQTSFLHTIDMGDAADLIATYGEGVHTARVEVVAEDDNESARTQTKAFELRQSAPAVRAP